ncbi:unnamed protein product [Parajaminaea phylloscopi]
MPCKEEVVNGSGHRLPPLWRVRPIRGRLYLPSHPLPLLNVVDLRDVTALSASASCPDSRRANVEGTYKIFTTFTRKGQEYTGSYTGMAGGETVGNRALTHIAEFGNFTRHHPCLSSASSSSSGHGSSDSPSSSGSSGSSSSNSASQSKGLYRATTSRSFFFLATVALNLAAHKKDATASRSPSGSLASWTSWSSAPSSTTSGRGSPATTPLDHAAPSWASTTWCPPAPVPS